MTSQAAAKVGLKQETLAIVAVGLTILGTVLLTTSRLEARIDRIQAETRTDIERIQAETRTYIERVQVETRAYIERVQVEIRAEARADREVFSREILRLTSEQSHLTGIVEGPRVE